MKKTYLIIIAIMLLAGCYNANSLRESNGPDIRPPLMNTNAFSSFMPLEIDTETETNELDNLDEKIESIINTETNKLFLPLNLFSNEFSEMCESGTGTIFIICYNQ